jgi:hypothetical protein
MNTAESIIAMNKVIVSEIKREVSIDVPTDCLEKLNNLVCYLGNSTECLSRSKYFLNLKKSELLKLKEVQEVGATDRKLLLEAMAAKEVYCNDFSESVNKDLHYAIEGLRTIVSAQKEEFKRIMQS